MALMNMALVRIPEGSAARGLMPSTRSSKPNRSGGLPGLDEAATSANRRTRSADRRPEVETQRVQEPGHAADPGGVLDRLGAELGHVARLVQVLEGAGDR